MVCDQLFWVDAVSGCPHTDFRKGQRVILTFTNGVRVIDRYVEKKSGVIVMERLGRVQISRLRAATIYRGQRAVELF